MRSACRLCLYLLLVFSLVTSQAQENQSPYYLPDINVGIEFELEHVFTSHQRQDEQPDRGNTNTDAGESMLLIGTLINGGKRLAWIKTHEYYVHELSEGQRVPGSTFRLNKVYSNSVELVDNEQCRQVSNCSPLLVLELN